jgi:single-stranded-DNA-specific exonuclease
METRQAVFGVETSLSGKAWRWRGGNMALAEGAGALDYDIVDQLLLGRGVGREELALHRSPNLRTFLPDPSIFNDMDTAADLLAQSVLAGEQVTVIVD